MSSPNRLPAVLERLTGIAIVLVVLVSVVVLVAAFFTDGGLDLPVQFAPEPESHSVTSDAWGQGTIHDATGLVRFEERDAALVSLSVANTLFYMVPAIALLFLLRRFLRTLASGEPFVGENARTLRWIGSIAIVFGLVAEGLQTTMAVAAMNSFATEGVHLEARFVPDLSVVFIGLVLLAVAEAFRRGTDLQADSDLTI